MLFKCSQPLLIISLSQAVLLRTKLYEASFLIYANSTI